MGYGLFKGGEGGFTPIHQPLPQPLPLKKERGGSPQ